MLKQAALFLLTCAAPPLRAMLAEPCRGYSDHTIVCVNDYAAVMPQPFLRFHPRDGSISPLDTFPDTEVRDPSFELVENATFIVFNHGLATEVLGEEPELETLFDLKPGTVRDAATYVPCIDSILFSSFEQETVAQHIIDLSKESLTIEDYVPDPPVFAVNGGTYFNQTVFWAVGGGRPFKSPISGDPIPQAPGIVALDPFTNKTTEIVNNYYGARFNGLDDLCVASNGDIFFTDAYYAWAENVTLAPNSPPATWRFRPSTGRVQIVESSLVQPNGVALSSDESTLYSKHHALISCADAVNALKLRLRLR